jgi:hypothetical protein
MAKRDKNGWFLKGTDPGPGRKPMAPEAKRDFRLSRQKVMATMSRFVDMSVDDLKAFINAKQGSALEMYIASMLAKGIQDGDVGRIDFLLNRTIGKVVERVDMGLVKPYVIERQDGTEVVLGQEEVQQIEGETDEGNEG